MQILTDSGPALTSVSVVPGILMLPSVWYAGRSYQKPMYCFRQRDCFQVVISAMICF